MTNRKRIVLLSDGTGNSAHAISKSNVWRLYKAINLNNAEQIAKYDDGVGTSSFKPWAILGGALGFGLARNVKELYAFLCRHYDFENCKDEIYLFGFSRGAFTIRLLSALIDRQGLVKFTGDDEDLKRKVNAAYRDFRGRFFPVSCMVRPATSTLRFLRDTCINIRNRIFKYETYDPAKHTYFEKNASSDKLDEKQGATIRFVGVWDTVDAYGLPMDEMTIAWDRYFWPLHAPDRDIARNIEKAWHALSLDDERHSFKPVLWNEESDQWDADVAKKQENAETVFDERITQVWFAGMHSDVGGSYPDDAMAYVPLRWMIQGAQEYDLEFHPSKLAQIEANCDIQGPMHNSRKAAALFYRYAPRKLSRLCDDQDSYRKKNKVKIGTPKIHYSVLERIKSRTENYAPYGLPKNYNIVDDAGKIHGLSSKITGHHIETDTKASDRATQQETNIYPLMKKRKWMSYYPSVALVLLALAAPFIWGSEFDGACSSNSLCWLSFIPRWLSYVLPAFTGTWLKFYQSNPDWMAILLAAGAALWLLSSYFVGTMKIQMRKLWDGKFDSEIKEFQARSNEPDFWDSCKTWIIGIVFALIMIVLANKAIVSFLDSAGYLCSNVAEVKSHEEPFMDKFASSSSCANVGYQIQRGHTYKVSMSVDALSWKDASIDANLAGLNPKYLSGKFWVKQLKMASAIPIRRHWSLPWFSPVLRIGENGRELIELDIDPPLPPGDENRHSLTGKFTARTTGQLFFYVNDAIIVKPDWGLCAVEQGDGPKWCNLNFYKNNGGEVSITIEKISRN